MLTLYIHCLEVLAMKAEGQTVNTIVQMGCEWSSQKVVSALKGLEKEGYVKSWKVGRTTVWQILEKACEYCERIARLYGQSHVMDEIADYVESVSQDGIAPTQDTITDVSQIPQALSAMTSKITMPLMGEMTIDEAVKAIESASAVKVIRATLEEGVVTLTYEPLPDVNTVIEFEDCCECGWSCNYHEDWCPYNYA